MDLVPVTTIQDAGLANVVRAVLEQAGIQAVVAAGGSRDVYPMPSVHPFEILVSEGDAGRARDVLAQYDTMPDDSGEEE